MKIAKLLCWAMMLLPAWAMADSWNYHIAEDDFVDGYNRMAFIIDSEDIIALAVSFSPQYEQGKMPMVGLAYGESSNYIPNFCHDDCPIYLNVDGKKFPVFKALRNDDSYMFIKDSSQVLKAIKNAKVIKVQLPPPLWGDVNVHTFHIDEPLDISKLQTPNKF